MRLFNFDPKMDILGSSGVLRVTVRPRPSLALILFEASIACIFATSAYRNWSTIATAFRIVSISAVVSIVGGLIYQLSGLEIIEFSAQKLRICKEIHGWERNREYGIEDCSQLEWMEGEEGRPQSLRCAAGWKKITFGENLSESQAMEIFVALQASLPEVAQKICSFPEGKNHFITLGLK